MLGFADVVKMVMVAEAGAAEVVKMQMEIGILWLLGVPLDDVIVVRSFSVLSVSGLRHAVATPATH